MLAPALHLMMHLCCSVQGCNTGDDSFASRCTSTSTASNGARAGVHERVGVMKLLLNYAGARTRGHNVNHDQSPTYFTFNGCSV